MLELEVVVTEEDFLAGFGGVVKVNLRSSDVVLLVG